MEKTEIISRLENLESSLRVIFPDGNIPPEIISDLYSTIQALKQETPQEKPEITVEWLVNKINEKGKFSIGLDDIVYDDFAGLANNKNNQGAEAQIEYLIERGMSLEEIGAQLDIYPQR